MSFDILAWTIILFWIGFRAILPVTQPKEAFGLALVVVLAGFVFTGIMPLMVAILAPFGFLVPALALRDICARMGGEVTPFQVPDVAVVFVASTLFIAASIGVFSFDPYRLGYSPKAPAIACLIGIVWAVWRRQFFVLGSILAAQLTWSLGYWSPNFFDLAFHAILVPICGIWLIKPLLDWAARHSRPVD